MIPLALVGAAWAFETPAVPCATLDRLNATRRVAPPPLVALGPPGQRDPYQQPYHLTSEHFAVHWGDAGNTTEAQIERLLVSFELAWDVVVDEMGHPRPATSDVFLFNVYIGDTGGPSGYGAGGYYTTDGEGYPMIVIARDSIEFDPAYADHAAQHEFYHAIQGSTNRFAYDGASAWYWEATAEWAAIEIDDVNPYNGPFVYAYLILPSLPVDFFDYPDTGTLQEYFQYGAFLFPHALTEEFGYELVRDAWITPGSNDDPLEVMRAWIAAEGGDLDAAWLDHLARNVVYDYSAGDVYRQNVSQFAPYFPNGERITAQVSGDGGSGHVRGPGINRYGAANLLLTDPSPGTLEVRLTGAGSGSLGSPSQYGARVVRDHGDGTYTYEEVPFEGVTGTLNVPDAGDEVAIWVTVGAWTTDLDLQRWTEEVFPLEWSLAVVPPPEPTEPTGDDDDDGGPNDGPGVVDGEDPASCGCRTGPSNAGWLGLFVLAWRRRRTR